MPVIASIEVLWPGKTEREESLTWYPSHYIKKAGSPKAMRDFPAVILCWEHLVLAQKAKVYGG